MTITTKNILVIAISDHVEAMRVASGLTIYGHEVQLVFADRCLEESDETIAQAETLDLADITPVSLLDDPLMERIKHDDFRALTESANHILSI
jgi:hypothetical protein